MVRTVMIVLAVVGLCGCASGTEPPPVSEPESELVSTSDSPAQEEPAQEYTGDVTSVVIDTDMSIDDMMAIAMLVESPRVSIEAVSITAAFVRCPVGETIMLDYLATLGEPDIPVACGALAPVEGNRAFPPGWRDEADRGWQIPTTPSSSTPFEAGGVALLDQAISGGAATVVVLGPHTNLALAVRENPALVDSIEQVVTMGGAVDVPGNVYDEGPQPPVAEWNIYVDPVAAQEVFSSGIPVVMVGLDATNQVPVESPFVERMRDEGSGATVELMLGMIERYRLSDAFDSYFWDQLAVAYLLDPAVVALENTTITVVTDDGPDSGRTIRDPEGSAISIATGADRELFETVLIDSLSGR